MLVYLMVPLIFAVDFIYKSLACMSPSISPSIVTLSPETVPLTKPACLILTVEDFIVPLMLPENL